MDLRQVKIETDRLVQVPITMKYRDDIFREFTREITTWMYPKPADEVSETEAFINSALEGLVAGSNLQLVILIKATGEFAGCSGLHKTDTATPELGIWVKKGAHGNGYGREAITGLVAWARKNRNCDRLVYPVDRRNTPSRRIPESLGGRVMREFASKGMSGNELDVVEYWLQGALP